MKRIMMACLLAASSHGWAANLDPECHTLYEQFLAADWVNAGRIAGRMHDLQCWPALQGIPDSQPTEQPAISTCNDLVPHIVNMVNANETQLMKVYNPKPMTYDTIDRVAEGHNLYQTITDNQGRSARFRKNLMRDGKVYVIGEHYYARGGERIGNQGVVLVPDSPPFAANPLAGTQRVLDCSGEARYTFGMWLIQMYLDRDPDGQEFVGMSGLMELR